MATLQGSLLPFSYFRSWSYNELIPSLLYLDKVAIPSCGLHSVDVLTDPKGLAGIPDSEDVGFLTAGEHRFFWPLRDLIQAGVLVPFYTDPLLI